MHWELRLRSQLYQLKAGWAANFQKVRKIYGMRAFEKSSRIYILVRLQCFSLLKGLKFFRHQPTPFIPAVDLIPRM